MVFSSAIISIGNELLLGRTLNSNLAWLGKNLADLGIPVHYSETIPDDPEAIIEALDYCWKRYDVVITTGGLGPTQDDITRESIAKYFAAPLRYDEEIWLHICRMFAHRNTPMPESNRCQAMVPNGFRVLKNDRGTAPGLHFSDSGKQFFALQGVPLEMRYIFNTHIRGILKQSYKEAQSLTVLNIHTYGIGESALAEKIDSAMIPAGVSLAWLPQTGRVDLRLYGEDSQAVAKAGSYVEHLAKEYIWGYDEDEPARYLLNLMKNKALTLSVAESCTGGLVQRYLTDIPGASATLMGGVVSYANSVKVKALGVPQQVLEKHGAVSEECARAMALGVQKLCESDVSIAVTGIAGPDGGSPDKPVGTVYYAFRIIDREFTVHKIFNGDRESIRHKAAEAAILELARCLGEI